MMPPIRRRERWSTPRRVGTGILVTIALAWVVSALAVLRAAGRDEATAAHAILVLGAAQYRGRPSPVLRARLEHAVELYARGLAPRVMLTGGTAEGDTASEALVSRRFVLAAGVPDSSILLENEGRTTSASIRRAAPLLLALGTPEVILVSDPFHVLRAGIVARRAGLRVHRSPTSTTNPLARAFRQPGYFLGETVKAPLALLLER